MGSPKEKFQFPECWSNDSRMSALMAPFRSKSVNPTDWTSKMNFWMTLIENWCKFNKCPIVKISSLKQSFSRKGVTPACLDDIFQNMSSMKIIVNKDDFMAPNESWKSWAVKVLVTNPLRWTFNTVKSAVIKENEQKEVCYVHLPVIKYLGENLVNSIISSHKTKLVTFDELLNCGFENTENLSVVVHWLHKQQMVGIHTQDGLMLVKFSKNSQRGVEVTETDIGIYSLEKQQKLLEDNIKNLETEKMAALDEAKKHIGAKMKNMAKISLRRKNAIEKIIEKRSVMLENIQGILYKIDQAKLDSEVIKCYQNGISALKDVFSSGLTEGTVLETMDELKEVLNSRNDIEQALAEPMDEISSEELEDELNELLLKEAPDVPKESLPTPEKKASESTKELASKMEALSL